MKDSDGTAARAGVMQQMKLRRPQAGVRINAIACARRVADIESAEDDGYLSASEVRTLKLNADWVILSVCNTAAGDASGAEALSGLARALLVSHWAVDSNATVKLITAAMSALAQDPSIGRAEALRRSMLLLIDNGELREAHPAFSAPFVFVGGGMR